MTLEIFPRAVADSIVTGAWTLLPDTQHMMFPFQKDSWILDPFQIAAEFSRNEIREADWNRQCQDLGIADWDLSDVVTPESGTTSKLP